MPLYRATLAYDGTAFEGWQLQTRPGARTVQGVVEAALARLTPDGTLVRVHGAGRTDAGVHALGQVISFELSREMTPDELGRALNGLLPLDVRVLEAGPAAEGFHARRSAISKLYRYVLDVGPVRLPMRRHTAGYDPGPLDAGAVRGAAEVVLGTHDFRALAAAGSTVRTTVRTVTASRASFEADLLGTPGATLVYEVEADGFLRKMVRNIVGGLVAAGRGRTSPSALARALAAGDRTAWPPPAEAGGLTLVRVVYGAAPGSPARPMPG